MNVTLTGKQSSGVSVNKKNCHKRRPDLQKVNKPDRFGI